MACDPRRHRRSPLDRLVNLAEPLVVGEGTGLRLAGRRDMIAAIAERERNETRNRATVLRRPSC